MTENSNVELEQDDDQDDDEKSGSDADVHAYLLSGLLIGYPGASGPTLVHSSGGYVPALSG